jgi:hypothetical protein
LAVYRLGIRSNIGAFGDGSASLWSLTRNRPALRLRHRIKHYPEAAGIIYSAALSKDNQSILAGTFRGAWLWNVGSGALKARLTDISTTAFRFASSGDIMLAHRRNPGVRIVHWSEISTDTAS